MQVIPLLTCVELETDGSENKVKVVGGRACGGSTCLVYTGHCLPSQGSRNQASKQVKTARSDSVGCHRMLWRWSKCAQVFVTQTWIQHVSKRQNLTQVPFGDSWVVPFSSSSSFSCSLPFLIPSSSPLPPIFFLPFILFFLSPLKLTPPLLYDIAPRTDPCAPSFLPESHQLQMTIWSSY